MKCGFSMSQIGEFSFIIASMGLGLGVIGKFLYPVVVAVSVITTFLTPYMIKLANPVYCRLEKHLPDKLIHWLNSMQMSHPHTTQRNKWKRLLYQMSLNTIVYGILSAAVIAVMFTFVLPVVRRLLPGWDLHWYANAITGIATIVLIAPFLRAMVMKKNHSDEFKRLWVESNFNRPPLVFTIVVRFIVALMFVFYIINYLTRFTNALMICMGAAVVGLIMYSRLAKTRSIKMERQFMLNLRSRDIQAQVQGTKRPLYAGHLLDRDIHIGHFELPEDSLWAGKKLSNLQMRNRFGVHVSSILRGAHRINIPNGETVLFPGDQLQVIGNDDQLKLFGDSVERELVPADLEVEKREMKLRQMIISGSGGLVGKTLKASGIRDLYGCMVVGVEEGQENLTMMDPKRTFEKGDIVWVVGEEDSLKRLFEANSSSRVV